MYPSCMLSDAQRTSHSLTSIARSRPAKHTMGCVFASSSANRTSNAWQDIAEVGCGAPTASRWVDGRQSKSLYCAWPYSSLLAFRSSAELDVGPQLTRDLLGRVRSKEAGR